MSTADVDDIAASFRRERAMGALLPLFFVSGATSLVYQTVWARELHLVFGTSTFAIATVLSAFMAGLALGGVAMSRVADRIRQPLRVYGVLEAGIGLYALLFPWIVAAVTPVYLGFWRSFEPHPVVFGAVQFALVGSALLLPTAAMGATLPLLARFATDRMGAAGDRVGKLYGVNTFGAVFGTWLAGFVLLPGFGLSATTWSAAAANLVLGLAAVLVAEWTRGAEQVSVTRDVEVPFLPALPKVALALGLAGFASLVYEVAWFRLLGLMLGASVYAFSTMLLAFLTGIAAGGTWGGALADRVLARSGQEGVLRLLAGLQVGVAAASFAMMYVYPELPFWYVWLFDWLGAERDPTWMWVLSLVLSGLVMTPPALLMGATFPVAVRAVVGDRDELGGPVGRIYAANTLGAVFGAALAGFVLLPTLGVQGAVFAGACFNLVGAVVVGRVGGRVVAPAVALVGVVLGYLALTPPWNPLLMTAGMYKYVSMFSDHSREGIRSYAVGKYDLLYYREGLTSVVTVAKNRDSGNIWLANNGKVDASTTSDMPTQVLVSLLPFQFVEAPEDVLVIGLASGVTAGAITTVDDVERLDIVEIEPAILEAARLFGPWNHDVLDDPRSNLVANDGRNHLLLTAPGTYDVIVSEPSNPWITGVSNLFTREFFEMGRERLAPGGVWAQWVQMYGMDERDLRSLLGTFAEVYPHVLLYTTIEDADLVLVGSDEPLVPTLDRAEGMMRRWPAARDELALAGVDDAVDLLALFQMDRDGLVELAGSTPRNTDDNMRIEYAAPLNLHESTADENIALLVRNARIPKEGVRTADEMARLAEAYRERNSRARSIIAMGEAALMAPKASEARDDYVRTAVAWQQELAEE